MYAVVETGGKQYKVSPGQQLRVERLDGEAGTKVVLDKVLMIGGDTEGGQESRVGSPVVDGAQVVGRIVSQEKTKKVLVFKKKRRKDFRKTQGHRQQVTKLEIEEIQG